MSTRLRRLPTLKAIKGAEFWFYHFAEPLLKGLKVPDTLCVLRTNGWPGQRSDLSLLPFLLRGHPEKQVKHGVGAQRRGAYKGHHLLS